MPTPLRRGGNPVESLEFPSLSVDESVDRFAKREPPAQQTEKSFATGDLVHQPKMTTSRRMLAGEASCA
jgi:hypothetical protein